LLRPTSGWLQNISRLPRYFPTVRLATHIYCNHMALALSG
jgi:hypothetical protein